MKPANGAEEEENDAYRREDGKEQSPNDAEAAPQRPMLEILRTTPTESDADESIKAMLSALTPRPPTPNEDDMDDYDEEDRDKSDMIALKHVEKHAFLQEQSTANSAANSALSDPIRREKLRLENNRLMYIARRRSKSRKLDETLANGNDDDDKDELASSSRRHTLRQLSDSIRFNAGASLRSIWASTRTAFPKPHAHHQHATASAAFNKHALLPPSFAQNGRQRDRLLALVKQSKFKDSALLDAITCKRPLHPNGTFRSRWDQFLILAVVYTLIVVPFEVAFFNAGDWNLGLSIAGCVLDIVFILDLVLNFRTSYRGIDDEYVLDSKKIAKHYAKTWLTFDLIAAVPINIIQVAMMEQKSEYFAFAKILKFFRIFRLRHLFEKLAGLRASAAIYLLVLVTFYVIIAHWAACIFFLIAMEQGLENSWARLVPIDLMTAPVAVQYSSAMEWSIATITTLGYGDIHPVTYAEQIYTTIYVVCGAVLYASVIGLVSFIIRSQFSSELGKEFFFNDLKAFGRQYKLTPRLQKRIFRYYEFLYERTRNGGLADEVEIVTEDLPVELRGDIALAMHRKLLYTNNLLRECNSLGFREVLAARLNPATIRSPHDVLYFVGDVIQEVFFIKKGMVQMVVDMDTEEREMIVYRLGDAQHCGEMGLFDDDMHHTLSCLVVEFTDFNTCFASDLLQVFALFPRERALFEAVARERQEKIDELVGMRNSLRERLENLPILVSPIAATTVSAAAPPSMSRRSAVFSSPSSSSPRRELPRMSSKRSGGSGTFTDVLPMLPQRILSAMSLRRDQNNISGDTRHSRQQQPTQVNLSQVELDAFRKRWQKQINPDFDSKLVKRICGETLLARKYKPLLGSKRNQVFSSQDESVAFMRSPMNQPRSIASPPPLPNFKLDRVSSEAASPSDVSQLPSMGSEQNLIFGGFSGSKNGSLPLLKQSARRRPALNLAYATDSVSSPSLSSATLDILGAAGVPAGNNNRARRQSVGSIASSSHSPAQTPAVTTTPETAETKLAKLVERLNALQVEYDAIQQKRESDSDTDEN